MLVSAAMTKLATRETSGIPVRKDVGGYFRALLDKSPSSGKTLNELDGLRGLAVLIVIASHTQAFGMKGQGALGVWLFFVLSGFLLTKIILQNLPESLGINRLTKYFIRRVARIIPMYYFVLCGVFFLNEYGLDWLFLHVTFQRGQGHFWSIPQEEVFYLLLPILMSFILLMTRLLRVVPSLAIVTALLLVVDNFGPVFSLHGNGKLLPFYLNIFLQGVLVAFLWRALASRDWDRSKTVDLLVNLVSIPVLLAVIFASPTHHVLYQNLFSVVPPQFGWGFPFRSGVACSLLLLITLHKGSWVNRVLSWPPFRVIGVLSFALYLIHPSVIKLVRYTGLGPGVKLFLVSLGVSIVISLVLERVVERPCMAFGRRINSSF